MNKYIIVSLLGDMPAGTEFQESKWPLHVTLTRAIHSKRDEQEFIDTLTKALEGQKPFELVGKSEEMFGPNHDRPVTELALTEEITALNALLKKSFSDLADQPVSDKYPTYRPHVTRQGDEGISIGEKIMIRSASIVLANDGESRKVISTIHFG